MSEFGFFVHTTDFFLTGARRLYTSENVFFSSRSWVTKSLKRKQRSYRREITSGDIGVLKRLHLGIAFLAAVGTDERYLFCASPNGKRLLLGHGELVEFFFAVIPLFANIWEIGLVYFFALFSVP
jgi:hypothetical protein